MKCELKYIKHDNVAFARYMWHKHGFVWVGSIVFAGMCGFMIERIFGFAVPCLVMSTLIVCGMCHEYIEARKWCKSHDAEDVK